MPSLYIGAVTGGLYGTAAHLVLPQLTDGSGAFALVGMAGLLAAATHSPITAVLLLFEVSGDYQIILPVMLVATLATLVGRALSPESLYTLQLTRRGIALHRREDVIMRSHTVGSVMRPAVAVLSDRTPIGQVVAYFLGRGAISIYVTDAGGRFVGTIFIHDVQDPETQQLGPLLVAGEIAQRTCRRCGPRTRWHRAWTAFC